MINMPLLTGSLWLGVVVLVKVPFISKCCAANNNKDENNSLKKLHTKYCTSRLISKIQTDNADMVSTILI